MKRLIILMILISHQSFAVKRYYSLSRSVRAHGMGGAFYGLSDDEYAMFYNPAGLGVYRGGGQFMLATRAATTLDTINSISIFSKTFGAGKTTTEIVNELLSFQGKPLSANVSFMPSFLTKNFAIGLLLPDAKLDVSVLGDGLDTAVDLSAIVDGGLLFSFAKQFLEKKLSVGLTPKLIGRVGGTKTISALEITQGNSLDLKIDNIGGFGLGVDFDLGATYELESLPFGLANRVSFVLGNVLGSSFPIASSKKGDSKGVPGLTRLVTLAWYTAFPGVGVIDNFHFVLDLAEFGIGGETDNDRGGRGGSFWKHVNFGLEAPIKGWFVPRTGFHQGNLTAGFGIRLRFLQLDYAWFGEELMSGVGRYTARTHELRLAFGFGAPVPGPIVREKPESKPEGLDKPLPKEGDLSPNPSSSSPHKPQPAPRKQAP